MSTPLREHRAMLLACAAGALLVLGTYGSAADAGRPAVERVVLKFKSGVYSLVSRHALSKTIPPSDSLPADANVSGFFYELRDASGNVRYRRIIGNPVRLSFEGPPPGARNPSVPERVEAVPEERTFSVLIPLAAPTDVLVIFSSPLEPSAQHEPVSEVGRITFEPVVG